MPNFHYLSFSLLLLPLMANPVTGTEIKNPVELAQYVAALGWCRDTMAKTEEERQTYGKRQAQAEKDLDQAITQKIITKPEISLITQRVKEQGRYFGERLTPESCLALGQSQKEDNYNTYPWQLLISSQGNFAVEMPGKPKSYREVFRTNEQDFTWLIYDLVVTPKENSQLEKGEYYLIGYLDVTPEYLESNSQEKIFDNIAKYLYLTLLKEGATIDFQGEQSFTGKKASGKAFWAKVYDRDAVLVTYLYENRLYVNFLLSSNASNFKRFLLSFEILEFNQ